MNKLAYVPRDHFVDFHQRAERWALMVCHRRAGKTVACVQDLILKASYTNKENARFGYIAPFRQQAKEIAWQYLKDGTDGMREGPPRESELRVKLPNGAWITLYGADNPDAMRGVYFDGLILDEYGDMRPSLYGEVILPTLVDRRGWLAAIGTPKGRNQFYDLTLDAIENDKWFYKELKASNSGILPEDDLAQMAAEMSAEEYAQEFECSFDAAVKGTFYAHLINQAEEEGRCEVFPDGETLFDPEQKVTVVADLGFSDTCSWWFWQRRADGFAMIDYYESSGKDLSHYLLMLALRKYEYDVFWLPHDAKAKTLQTGVSTVEQLLEPWRLVPEHYEAGKRLPLRIVPKLQVQHGIEAARRILPQCWFDKNTTFKGLEALRSYRRQWHDHNQTFAQKPLHDWSSNGADAFRYFSLVAKNTKGQSAEVHLNRKPRTARNIPPEQPWTCTLDEAWSDHEDTLRLGRGRI